jgi:hypothetical protein
MVWALALAGPTRAFADDETSGAPTPGDPPPAPAPGDLPPVPAPSDAPSAPVPGDPPPAPTPGDAPSAPAPVDPSPQVVPPPAAAARAMTDAKGDDAGGAATDPRARPYFIKGELTSGQAVRPLGKRSFVGAGVGIVGVPSSAGTALSAFYFTIEPQVDLRVPARHNLKLGLSVPLNFEIADTRAAFERCVPIARDAKNQSGGDQQIVLAATAQCIEENRDLATENLGQVRTRDWDEVSDYARVIRYVTLGGEEQPFYLNVSRLYGQSVGHGTVVRRYNPNLDYDTARVGVTFDAYRELVGFESMVNDVLDPDVMGLLVFVRPFETLYPEVTPLRSFSIGAQVTAGLKVPRRLRYEAGIFAPAVDRPIPAIDAEADLIVDDETTVVFLGLDVETKVVRTDSADLKLYGDFQKMQGHGGGLTVGALARFSFGRPASQALRVRAELFTHDADYVPSFFDSFYDVHKLFYFPAAYRSAGIDYAPTKLGFLEASAGGPRRGGVYLEVTHSIVGWLTAGLSLRTSTALGDPVDAGFVGPRFDDLGQCPIAASGAPDCSGVAPVTVADPGRSSLLLYAEIPFRRFLQAFVSYEVYSTAAAGEGLDLGSLDGDNEVLFSGARLQLLPILFIQAEARRFYFVQRLSKIDLDMQVLEQDQHPRADWTFGVNIYAGLEF